MITITIRPGQLRNQLPTDNGDFMLLNWRVASHRHGWRPQTDLIELEDRYLVRVEIAGMQESDFDISLDQNLLTIHGVRQDISTRRAYHQMEINFGEFTTGVEIPGPILQEEVSAEYKQGFLWVSLPKAPTRQIYINE